MLVTSRQRNWPWVEANSREAVESFSLEEAEACFRTYLGGADVVRYRTALMAFAERMERLPIAVAVAAAMLRDNADPVEEAAASLGLGGLETVADLLRKAVDRKPEADHLLLQAASVCAAGGFWLPLAGQISGLDEAEMRAARDRLVNASLLRVLDRDRRRFQLHALLRAQVRQRAPLAELEERHAAALEGNFGNWETRWKDCRECLTEVTRRWSIFGARRHRKDGLALSLWLQPRAEDRRTGSGASHYGQKGQLLGTGTMAMRWTALCVVMATKRCSWRIGVGGRRPWHYTRGKKHCA